MQDYSEVLHRFFKTDCEDDYYDGDEVTYLRDAGREPSLGTFIQQFNSYNSQQSNTLCDLQNTVPSNTNKMSSFSKDPVLTETVNDEICSVVDSIEEDLADFSPEMFSVPKDKEHKLTTSSFLVDITLKPKSFNNDCPPLESTQSLLNSEIESQSLLSQNLTPDGTVMPNDFETKLDSHKEDYSSNHGKKQYPVKRVTESSTPSTSNDTALKYSSLTCTHHSPRSETKIQKQTTSTYQEERLFSVPSLATLSFIAISKVTTFTENEDSINRPPFHSFDDPWDGDFSPDDDSDYQPNLNYDISNESTEDDIDSAVEEQRPKHKRAKKGKADKENWIYESNKIKRMKGENYSGRRKTEDGKTVFDVKRNSRSVKPRCNHNERCKYFECHKLTEDDRRNVFDTYWKMSWNEKKIFVQQTVQKQEVFRRKCNENNLRRKNTFKYSFRLSGKTIKVCKKMFLSTLNVGEWSVHNWTQNIEDRKRKDGDNRSRRSETVRAFDDFARNYVTEFLESLPKLESHYCRKSTSKLYLEEVWQSKQQLYREYVKQMSETGKQEYKVSTNIFFEMFDSMNLSLFSPKKDQCDLCCAYKVGNIADDVYQAHMQKKNRAREEKDRDKKDITNLNTKAYTFDLQAVLLAPALKASALYYKTKLKVHNFTIYDIKTGEGYCYIWNESEGGLSADEFSSILHKFIEDHVPQDTNHVIFWSDGCTYQNRNAILANALLLTAVQRGITITQKYLVKGHTQMEADSMHSTIERQLRNRDIYCPAQYIDICQAARLTKPYIVHYLNYSFFFKYSSMPYLKSIRPGQRRGESTVFDLQLIQYRTNGTICVKIDFDADFEELPRRVKKPAITDSMPPLHNSRISIPRSKYIHLQELKQVLPQDVHPFYDQLPHECPESVRNRDNCSCRKNVSI